VSIYADNDESYTGQSAAYTLARRLKAMGIRAQVFIPNAAGKDWADD
jgi:putative DNA primase/helicase